MTNTYEIKNTLDGDGKEYFRNGVRHRDDDKPAIEYNNGYCAWYRDGLQHREGGPAVILANGTKGWWLNGLLHREDGPALIYANGNKQWWLKGQPVTEERVFGMFWRNHK